MEGPEHDEDFSVDSLLNVQRSVSFEKLVIVESRVETVGHIDCFRELCRSGGMPRLRFKPHAAVDLIEHARSMPIAWESVSVRVISIPATPGTHGLHRWSARSYRMSGCL